HLHQERTGALQRLLRGLGAADRGLGTGDGGGGGAGRRLRSVLVRGQGKPPDPWRHGLHLGSRLPSVLPPRPATGSRGRRGESLERTPGQRTRTPQRSLSRRGKPWISTTRPKRPPIAPRLAPGSRPTPPPALATATADWRIR